ncbi:MAG: class I SAM-dependent methyltransferase [Rhodobacteraceae bacterium]|nr:class I SAM-dependent methyltransferase [Paracoccaceae bacterium]
MNDNGYSVMLDSATKFFRCIYIHGWFHHDSDQLEEVRLLGDGLIHQISETGIPHGGVQALGENLGFELQCIRSAEELTPDYSVEFRTKSGKVLTYPLYELCKDRIAAYPSPRMAERFLSEVAARKLSVLDVGGRARSKRDRSKEFDTEDYVVLDIIDGPNVDVVGDAHELSRFFPPDRFDAFYSVSVFEHLLMPWAVVLQLNRVLKTGGIGLISTHQTLGMHDMPWDFWRFSDTAWDALFNRMTGFEIIDRALDFDQYILPFIFRPSKMQAEKSVGFEGSAVLVRKIGPAAVSWDLTPAMITETAYPDNDDGYVPDGFGGLY